MIARMVLGLLTMLLLSACAAVPAKKAQAQDAQPVSEVVLLQCSKFQGAIVTISTGEVVEIDSAQTARAIFDALPQKSRGVIDTGTDLECAPSAAT